MPQGSRHRLAPRRRRTDDGDYEDSVIGDIDDDSSSDGSILSNDIDGDASDDEEHNEAAAAQSKEAITKPTSNPPSTSPIPEGARSAPTFSTTADTVAMMNGLKITEEQKNEPELHFDANSTSNGHAQEDTRSSVAGALPIADKETAAQKARREHQDYLKQRDSNPAFVPNRGGFFLHDDRSSGTAPYARPFVRGRGRGFNGMVHNG